MLTCKYCIRLPNDTRAFSPVPFLYPERICGAWVSFSTRCYMARRRSSPPTMPFLLRRSWHPILLCCRRGQPSHPTLDSCWRCGEAGSSYRKECGRKENQERDAGQEGGKREMESRVPLSHTLAFRPFFRPQGLLQRKAADRLSFEDFFNHPFVDEPHAPGPESHKRCAIQENN